MTALIEGQYSQLAPHRAGNYSHSLFLFTSFLSLSYVCSNSHHHLHQNWITQPCTSNRIHFHYYFVSFLHSQVKYWSNFYSVVWDDQRQRSKSSLEIPSTYRTHKSWQRFVPLWGIDFLYQQVGFQITIFCSNFLRITYKNYTRSNYPIS